MQKLQKHREIWKKAEAKLKSGERYIKRCLASLINKKMQIKSTMTYYLTLVILLAIIKKKNNECW